jgi:hypothetical protein
MREGYWESFGPPEREVVTEGVENYVMRSLVICAFTKYIRTMELRRTVWFGRVACRGRNVRNVLYKM